MLHRNIITSIIWVCFLWTGTFLHDVDQLELAFIGTDVQESANFHSGHYHDHHSGGHSKHIGHSHGYASLELAAVSGLDIHGHDPLLLGSGHRHVSADDSNLSTIEPIAFDGIGFAFQSAAVAEAYRPRPPPSPHKVPIYLLNRAILT
jgi:hypothetical protein